MLTEDGRPHNTRFKSIIVLCFTELVWCIGTDEILSVSANPTCWSSWLARLRQANSIKHREVFEFKTSNLPPLQELRHLSSLGSSLDQPINTTSNNKLVLLGGNKVVPSLAWATWPEEGTGGHEWRQGRGKFGRNSPPPPIHTDGSDLTSPRLPVFTTVATAM